MLFTANEMPICPDKSGAWLRRLCLLPFNSKPETKDPDLADKLREPQALKRLFVLAVIGLQALIGSGMEFPAPESTRELMGEYRVQNDSVVAFVEECCEIHEECWIEKTVFYEQYTRWCQASGLHAVGKKKAYKRLRDLASVGEGKDPGGTRMFKGIGLAAYSSTALSRHFHGSFGEGQNG
jgi:phage/plasmid-associated DNA primase